MSETMAETPAEDAGDGLGWLRLLVLDHEDAVRDFALSARGDYERVMSTRRTLIAGVAERVVRDSVARPCARPNGCVAPTLCDQQRACSVPYNNTRDSLDAKPLSCATCGATRAADCHCDENWELEADATDATAHLFETAGADGATGYDPTSRCPECDAPVAEPGLCGECACEDDGDLY